MTAAATLRVTLVITELDPGGAERALVRLAEGLVRQGQLVAVICLGSEAALCGPLREAGVEVICLGFGDIRDLRRRNELADAIASTAPDILHAFLFHANTLTSWCLPAIASRLGGRCPRLVLGHRVAERGKRWHAWAMRAAIRRAESASNLRPHHVAVSRAVAAFVVEAGVAAEAEVSVITNGVDAERFASAAPDMTPWGDGFGGTRLLAVGRLTEQKNFVELTAAVSLAADRGHNVRLVIAGEGDQRQLIEAAADPDRVRLVGRVSDPAPLYRAADLFVLSSQWEGLPNVLLEALAAGCPVVCTDVEGVADVLPSDYPRSGFSRLELADAIDAALSGPPRPEKMQAIVRERFTWESCVEGHLSLYRRLTCLDEAERSKTGERDWAVR